MSRVLTSSFFLMMTTLIFCCDSNWTEAFSKADSNCSTSCSFVWISLVFAYALNKTVILISPVASVQVKPREQPFQAGVSAAVILLDHHLDHAWKGQAITYIDGSAVGRSIVRLLPYSFEFEEVLCALRRKFDRSPHFLSDVIDVLSALLRSKRMRVEIRYMYSLIYESRNPSFSLKSNSEKSCQTSSINGRHNRWNFLSVPQLLAGLQHAVISKH